jgi:tetratricopeptide (TPR) repeat protein
MAIDVYSPCPCGSGKKLKFCCHDIVHDMQNVLQLRQNGQPRQALKALEKIEARAPRNPWMLTVKAAMLADQDETEAALQTVDRLLEASPNHPYGLYLRATSLFREQGFEAARPAIEKAYEYGIDANPVAMAGLSEAVMYDFFHSRQFLAVRKYITLLPRLAVPEIQSEILRQLMEFDSLRNIPYPLRSEYPLRTAEQAGVSDPRWRRAEELADHFGFGQAADLFSEMADRQPKNAAIRYNAGLCYAWAAESRPAAEALHRAAALEADFEKGVEIEVLAQLVEQGLDEQQVEVSQQEFRVEVASRLLTRLGEHPTYVRSRQFEEEEEGDVRPAGTFYVLDRQPPESGGAPPTAESAPRILGELAIFDADNQTGAPARAYLTASPLQDLAALVQTLKEQVGDEIEVVGEPTGVLKVPAATAMLSERFYYSPGTSLTEMRRHRKQALDHVLNDVWPHTQLAALNGKTPHAAIGDEALRVRLAASLIVLDAYCDRVDYVFPLDDFRDRLKLPERATLALSEDADVSSLTPLELQRLALHELSDQQLGDLARRMLVVQHRRTLYDVMTQVVSRPAVLETFRAGDIYHLLADLCAERGNREEALIWMAKAKASYAGEKLSFQERVTVELRELRFRSADPRDPQLVALLQHILNDYAPKIPELREQLVELARSLNLSVPGATAPPSLEPLTAGGLWTPESAAGAGQPGKLWLPGQD